MNFFKYKTMMFKITFGACWLVLLVGCSSMANNNITDNSDSLVPRLDKDMFSVVNDSKIQFGVYMNNTTDQEISNIKYEVFLANNNLMHNSILLTDLNHCGIIVAHSSCLLTFAQPHSEYQHDLVLEDNNKASLVNYDHYLGDDYTLEVSF